MTMPHLTNCAHSADGWCLACVKTEHDRAEKLVTACRNLSQVAQQMMRPFSERGARDVGVQAGADQWHAAWNDMKDALAAYPETPC